jgi:hypothetical protein
MFLPDSRVSSLDDQTFAHFADYSIGINSFGGSTKLSNVTITGSGGEGGDEFIKAPLTTELNNPSNVSLSTVDISLAVTYKDVVLGHAALNVSNFPRNECR